MSMGLVKFPAASIFNFSQICGSGEKGASPKVRQSTTRMGIGIDWIREIIVVGLRSKPDSNSLAHILTSLPTV